ncbi:MAG: outer membrane protein assembly factor BamD [Acidobacteriota bacterium]|nr:outer membrane protein assembly factor BamD [Acidobacteriota bacterium]
MRKKLLSVAFLMSAMLLCAPSVSGQGKAKTGPDPSTIRDPDLEKDSRHNLEVARNYFKLKKAYVAALKRCEEIIAGNPNFARIEEALFMAGASSLFLAENKGKQRPELYVSYDGTSKRTLSADEFRELGREYLTRLITDYPNSSFRKQAEADLAALGSAKAKTEGSKQ